MIKNTLPQSLGLRSHTRKVLALAVVIALCASAGLSVNAASPTTITIARATVLQPGDRIIGALPMAQPMHVEIALKMRDREGLDAFNAANARRQADGAVPLAMTPAAFLANHAPTLLQAQAVARYLTDQGYTHIVIAPNRLLLSADGTALTARNAFMTTFAQVRTQDGRIAFANTDDASIPAALKDTILAVVGLQTVHAAQASAAVATRSATQRHDPTAFPSIYGGAGTASAASIDVGMLTVGGANELISDLNRFTRSHGLAPVVTNVVNVSGTSVQVMPDSHSELQSQAIVGMAGSVHSLQVYNLPNTSNAAFTAAFNAIVAANVARVIALPAFNECEADAVNDGSALAQDAILASAVAQGQTFAVGTGDVASKDCASWPAASRYVIAVGGTQLNASSTAWKGETATPSTSPHASAFESMPSWQSALDVAGTKRALPDVAFDGSPSDAMIVSHQVNRPLGGTDLSSALFAGAWARVLQAKGPLGFAAPTLYALPAVDFHALTSNKTSLAMGYDPAGGRGSMIMDKVITDAAGLIAQWSYSQNGLAATFTDTSTDSAGTIVKHAWSFGDGTFSIAANPTHTYAADGTYTVTENVTDNHGTRAGMTQAAVVQAAAGAMQLLGNTGFETGTEAPWVMSSPSMLQEFTKAAHSGNWFVIIGSIGSDPFNDLSQRVAIPSGKTSVTLVFWFETGQNNMDPNPLAVDVYSLSKVRLARLALYNITNFPTTYVMKTLDMTPFVGQTVNLKFSRHNAGSGAIGEQGPWDLDDITLTVQ